MRVFGYFWVLFLIAYCLWMKFWPAILCCLIAFIAAIVIRCSIPRKKEALIRIAAVIMGICITGTITWCALFPTAYPYVDLWVLGKTEEQIIEVYGEPSPTDTHDKQPNRTAMPSVEPPSQGFSEKWSALRSEEQQEVLERIRKGADLFKDKGNPKASVFSEWLEQLQHGNPQEKEDAYSKYKSSAVRT